MSQLANPAERTAAEAKARPAAHVVPRVNIREEKDNYILELEMPGVRKDGLEITVMIEGGTRILGEAFDEHLVHEVCFYVAPILSGGPNPVTGGEGVAVTAQALRIVNPRYTRLGDDLRMSGEVSQTP